MVEIGEALIDMDKLGRSQLAEFLELTTTRVEDLTYGPDGDPDPTEEDSE